MVVADESTRVFSERLTPSFISWLIAPGVGTIFFIMFLPISTPVAAGVGLALTAVTGIWLWSLAAKVELTRTHLLVGRARIEVEALGEARVCSQKEMTHHMGPGSDARSYVLTRPWVHTGVYLEQIDPRDPTPYWLFTVRQPHALVEALQTLKEDPSKGGGAR